jgi:putative Mg2+ transporter-C (MgtC) family protein
VDDTIATESGLLLLAFTLCALVGLERQMSHKSAGLRTHALVGMGSAGFTLVSAYGFQGVTADAVSFDPSRIAAQIVSGIGFIGAGVIFTRRGSISGLTTAATIWGSAAIGMACGAGMIVLAVAMTGLHLVGLPALTRVARWLPNREARRALRVTYREGTGALRNVLATATTFGFQATIVSTRMHASGETVTVTMRFEGRPTLDTLLVELVELDGVLAVEPDSPGPSGEDVDEMEQEAA